MPTARPIIVARVGATVEIVARLLSRAISPMLTASPKTALRIGNPIATTVPKVRASTTIATTRPTTSLDSVDGFEVGQEISVDVLAQGEKDNFTVCFDREFAGWNEQEGQALFDAEGKNSAYLDEMIRFLNNFTAEMERTRQFVAKLAEFELLSPRSLRLNHSGGESFVLSDFLAVDEEKFLKLPDKKVLALNKAGYLGWVYAHLMSLANANELFARHLAGRNGDAAEDGEAKTH